MAGDLVENCRIDDDDDDDNDEDEVGDAIGNNIDEDVFITGSSIITSKVSEIFSITSLVCILDFCVLKLLLKHLNSLCKSCTCCKSCSFSLYCSSVPDLQINKQRDIINISLIIFNYLNK